MTAAAPVGHARSVDEDGMPEGVATARAWLAPAIAVCAVVAIVTWAARPYLVGVFHDDGVYALLAQSLARGEGFHYSHLPGTPAATHYPPLYPLLLSLVWRAAPNAPENTAALLRLNALLAGAAALGWWWFATRRLAWTRGAAALGASVAAVMLPTLALASALLSETMFLALLWPVLLGCERAADRPASTRQVLLAGAGTGALMLVRTHAVALLLALIIVLVVQRRLRDALMTLAAAAAVQAPWMLWAALATPHVAQPLEGSYGSYLGWFAAGVREGGVPFVARTVITNARESWLYLGDRVAAGFSPGLQLAATCILLAMIVAGAAGMARRARVTVLFAVLYFAIVAVWPYTPWRFLWAVWPLVVLFALQAVRIAGQLTMRARIAVVALMLLPALAMLRVELHGYAVRGWRAPARDATQQVQPVIAWVRANTAPTDVILSEGEQTIALYAGRAAAPPIAFTAREYLTPPQPAEARVRLAAMMRAVPAQWVILMAPGMVEAASALRGQHPGLEPVATLRTAVVFRVTP